MNKVSEAIYDGVVVHTRVRPIHHTLRYQVFSCLFDVDELEPTGKRLKLFSFNRFNLFSLYEKDFGEGGTLKPYLDNIARTAGFEGKISRFVMLCYPRVLGYAFNPLTVYFGLDNNDEMVLTIYEVSNTFGARKTYVLPAEPDADGLVWQSAKKELFVSPFNKVEGDYSFHLTPLGDNFTMGVALRDANGPKLKAYFRGQRKALTDGNLLRSTLRAGWLGVKVVAGIHWEAAKLFFKGLRMAQSPVQPETPITYGPAKADTKPAPKPRKAA